MIRQESYKVNPTKLYRISPDAEPMKPEDDPGIGIEFHPRKVLYNEVTNFFHVKSMLKHGTILPTAPYAKNYNSVELPEFVKRLREMVYDPENNLTLEAAVGGSERFDRIVAIANNDEQTRELQKYFPQDDGFWEDVFTSDTAFGGNPDY